MAKRMLTAKTKKSPPAAIVVSREALERVAAVLDALSPAQGLAPAPVVVVREQVTISTVLASPGELKYLLEPACPKVNRGKKSAIRRPGDSVEYHNAAKIPVVVEFWDNPARDHNDIARQELGTTRIDIRPNENRLVTVTEARTGRGHQDLYLRINGDAPVPHYRPPGGPDMGIDDPKP
jgi:hypothetical protein